MKIASSMIVLILTIFTITVTSCSGKDEKEKEKVVAEVDGTKITLSEFNQKMQQIPGMAHTTMDQEAKKKMLDNLIIRHLLIQEAMNKGLDKDKEVVDKMKDVQDRILLDQFLDKEIKQKAAVTNEEVKAYFEANGAEMKENEEIHAAHILVKSKDEADAVLKRLKKGENFAEIAKDKSEDPGSKNRGGDLGFFPRGQMVPAFEDAAFKLKPGELSDPVQTPFGYHIIKAIEKKGGKTLTLEAAQPMIQQKLMQEKQTKAFDTIVAALKAKAKITLHEDLLTEEAPPAQLQAPALAPAPAEKK